VWVVSAVCDGTLAASEDLASPCDHKETQHECEIKYIRLAQGTV